MFIACIYKKRFGFIEINILNILKYNILLSFKQLIMSKSAKKLLLEHEISSTQSSDGEDYIPKRIISKSNTRRIHKIPIEQQ